MTFTFDIDGTISSKPDVFREIMTGLLNLGHDVYPLTGTVVGVNQTGEEYRINQLKSLGIEKGKHYTDVVVCQANSVEEVGELKGDFCKKFGSKLLVEDSDIYIDSVNRRSPETLCLRMRP